MANELYKETAAMPRFFAGRDEQHTVTIYRNRLELLVQTANSADNTIVDFLTVEKYWVEDSEICLMGSFLKNGFEKVSKIMLRHPLSIINIANLLYLLVPVLVRNEGDLAFRLKLQNGILDENVPKGVIHFEFGGSVKAPPNIHVNRCIIRTVPTGSFMSKFQHDLCLPYDKYEIYVDISDEDTWKNSNKLVITLSPEHPKTSLGVKYGMINLKLKQL